MFVSHYFQLNVWQIIEDYNQRTTQSAAHNVWSSGVLNTRYKH